MKYKITTSKINDIEYVTGCILISEADQTGIAPAYLIDNPIPIADEKGLLQYAFVDGEIIHKPQAYSREQLNKKEIATLKKYLSDTDYIYTKCLELGLDVDIEYADVVSQRKSARTRIQELEVC
jgi:hypothetical protein